MSFSASHASREDTGTHVLLHPLSRAPSHIQPHPDIWNPCVRGLCLSGAASVFHQHRQLHLFTQIALKIHLEQLVDSSARVWPSPSCPCADVITKCPACCHPRQRGLQSLSNLILVMTSGSHPHFSWEKCGRKVEGLVSKDVPGP